jgi:hypothetical protein
MGELMRRIICLALFLLTYTASAQTRYDLNSSDPNYMKIKKQASKEKVGEKATPLQVGMKVDLNKAFGKENPNGSVNTYVFSDGEIVETSRYVERVNWTYTGVFFPGVISESDLKKDWYVDIVQLGKHTYSDKVEGVKIVLRSIPRTLPKVFFVYNPIFADILSGIKEEDITAEMLNEKLGNYVRFKGISEDTQAASKAVVDSSRGTSEEKDFHSETKESKSGVIKN